MLNRKSKPNFVCDEDPMSFSKKSCGNHHQCNNWKKGLLGSGGITNLWEDRWVEHIFRIDDIVTNSIRVDLELGMCFDIPASNRKLSSSRPTVDLNGFFDWALWQWFMVTYFEYVASAVITI